jgi:CHAD domain-containing protein
MIMAEVDGKWLSDVSPHDSLSQVAQSGLLTRLHTVYSLAPLAMHFGLKQTEYVHQLRVATRRSHVAFRVFRQVVPDKLQRRWLRRLRKVRRQAGPARDLDVFLERSRPVADHKRETKALVSLLRDLRRRLQGTLQKDLATHPWPRYPREVSELIERVRWRARGPEPTWAAAAFEALQQPMLDYLEAGQLLLTAHDPDDIARLHAFRIQGKRVRYRFELCSAIFADGPHRALVRRLTTIQQRLGQINDHAVAIRQMNRWLRDPAFAKVKPTLQSWIEAERGSLQLEVRRFGKYFTKDEWERIQHDWQGCKPSLVLARVRKASLPPKKSAR